MPGTITFKPLAASLNVKNKVDPYCTFTVGDQTAQSKPSGMGGQNPHWEDAVSLKVKDQARCVVELKDQKSKSSKSFIGNFEIDVREIESNGKLRQWYTVLNQDKPAGEILLEASYINDLKRDPSRPEESQKASQGNVPSSLDLDKTPFEYAKRATESVNSIARIPETNEFGDYQPEKMLFHGDQRHEMGGGWIQQGSYYSGQQTSYGEAFPMAHKSVAFNNIPTIEEYAGGPLPRGDNPTDYARYMHQAFVPHKKEISSANNTSVVQKAYDTAKRDDLYKNSAITPTMRLVSNVDYAANQDTSIHAYATEKALDEKERLFSEASPISGKTFGSQTDTSSRNESLADIIAREQDISKGVLQPTLHGNPGDPDSDHSAFRDIKNTKEDLYGTL